MTKAVNIWIEKFKALQNDLPLIVADVFTENQNVFEDLQTGQLDRGIDSEGNEIEPEYSPVTVQIKKLKGQPSDRVTLKDTGDFHNAMFLAGGGSGQFQIGNRDKKLNKLERKYGKEVLGLTDESKQAVIDDLVRPELPIKLRQYLLQ